MKSVMILTVWLIMIIMATPAAHGLGSRPKPDDGPGFARWIVSQNSWGVLTTLDFNKSPFGNVLSFMDAGTGIPYLYDSTKLDLTGIYAVADPRASLTVTEYVLGYCGSNDPQWPICAKLTLSGQLEVLNKSLPEGKWAEEELIKRHPQFGGFPKAMGFDVLKLNVQQIYLVNDMKPRKNVSVIEYFRV
ncbi:hypothetical protein ACS0TY_022884 [Phlomoides rotata]